METVVLKDLAAVQALARMDLSTASSAARERVLIAKHLTQSRVPRTTSVTSRYEARYQNGARGPAHAPRDHCIEYAVDNANLVYTDLLLVVLVVREQIQTATEQGPPCPRAR